MGSKWLALLRQIAPRAERVGLMLYPEPPNIGYLKSAEAAASSLNTKVVGLTVRSGTEIEGVISTFAAEPHGGLIIAPNVVTFANSDHIVALASSYRLPAIYPFAFYAKAGGLGRVDKLNPDADGGKQHECGEALGQFVVAGGDPT